MSATNPSNQFQDIYPVAGLLQEFERQRRDAGLASQDVACIKHGQMDSASARTSKLSSERIKEIDPSSSVMRASLSLGLLCGVRIF
jgi:hypothetical protein